MHIQESLMGGMQNDAILNVGNINYLRYLLLPPTKLFLTAYILDNLLKQVIY